MLWDDRLAVLVQGITGREASYWTERMLAYGTEIVAGVTPGKGGQQVHGIPVYDTVAEACARHSVDASVLFVPPMAVKDAALSAIEAGIPNVVILAEHVPVHDTMAVLAAARRRQARVIGPNCPGLVIPGQQFLGIMPAWDESLFRPGSVGVASRSGSLGNLICLYLVRCGLGQSAFIGLGGDAMVGTSFCDAVAMLDADPRTEGIVVVGEVGGTLEEDLAAVLPRVTKPVVAYIAGRVSPEGKRMGHAGAIVSGGRGGADAKRDALRLAGAHVADTPSQVGDLMRNILVP